MYTSNEETVVKYSTSPFQLFLPHKPSKLVHSTGTVSSNLVDVISDADLILVTTPADSHSKIAEELAKSNALKSDQIIVLNPGRTGGALEFLTKLRKNGAPHNLTIAEAQTLLFACRKSEEKNCVNVSISGIKTDVAVSAFPVKMTRTVVECLNECFGSGSFVAEDNYLKTTLMNVGAVFHPTPLLLNFARFDILLKKSADGTITKKPNSFLYYCEGISPATADFLEKIDQERIDVANAYGIKSPSVKDWLTTSYHTPRLDTGSTEHELYFMIQATDAYQSIKASSGINQRYITEDVPTGLVPISEFGSIANVPTPCIDSVIALASALYGRDFRRDGRNLINLGLNNLSLYRDFLNLPSEENPNISRAKINVKQIKTYIAAI